MQKVCKIIFGVILLGSTLSRAATLSTNVGEGTKGTYDKLLAVSYTVPFITEYFKLQSSAGAMLEGDFISKKVNFFGEQAVGAEVRTHGIYLNVFNGIAVISNKDRRLNSYWQFPTTLNLGLYNESINLGAFYKHFSNGTKDVGNRGKDFIGFNLGFRFR